ncbi:MAG: hypothetical protein MZW92_53795 [Comamonadaceae bacterium]|nr:hypothetical protein [Comamonadaceae bacterium]
MAAAATSRSSPPGWRRTSGKDKITVPVTKPPEIQPVKSPEDELPKMELQHPRQGRWHRPSRAWSA